MTKRFLGSNKIQELEYQLSKVKFVHSYFSDVQCNYDYSKSDDKAVMKFYSKTVNSDFEKIEFESVYNTLCAIPYSELTFVYNNKEESIKILPIPSKIVLAKKRYRRAPLPNKPYNYEEIIRFSRFTINNKKNAFNQDKLYQDCMVAIVNFVNQYKDIKTDVKHLDPRLRKLLAFS